MQSIRLVRGVIIMKYFMIFASLVLTVTLFAGPVFPQERGKIDFEGKDTENRSDLSQNEDKDDSVDLDLTDDTSGEPDMTRENQSTQGYPLNENWDNESVQIDLLSGFLYIGSGNQNNEIPASVMPPEMQRREFQDGPKIIRFKGIAK